MSSYGGDIYAKSSNAFLSDLDANFGAQADTAATNNTGSFSFIAFFKRLLTRQGQSFVTDSTGAYTFDLSSLADLPTYDANGNIATMTYGPDGNARSIRKTYTWTSGVYMGSTGWVLVP